MKKSAGNVFIKYNPYTVETIIRFDALNEHDGEEPKESSPLHRGYLNGRDGKSGKRLQEWIENLPSILEKSGREKSYTVTFHGTTLDYEDVKAVADASAIITSCEHIQGCDPEDKIIQLKQLFEDACKLGFDSITDFGAEIDKAFNTGFEAYVIATMSAGKSTLINALLGQKLMPSQNEACTAIVTRIFDTDSKIYSASAYGEKSDIPRETISELTYDTMVRLNSDDSITNIVIEGNIPFLDAKGIPLVIVDTPGPNNSRNTNHRARTMREIETGKQSFIVFLLDASQNGTDSEKLLLEDIAKAMKKGGKMSRDRFLFVVNKVDSFYKEPGNITSLLSKNRDGLAQYGINDARIYPVSAGVALTAKVGLERADMVDAAFANAMIKTPQLHLEQCIEGINSHIPASERTKITMMLEEARAKSDLDTQALIHSGVPSLEAAMKEYIEKYARAMRIGEIAEKLQTSFDCADKVTKLNSIIMTDGKKRDEILAAIDVLDTQIKSGEQGKAYEKRLKTQIEESLKAVDNEISDVGRAMSDEVIAYCEKHKEDRLSPDKAREIALEWKLQFEGTENKLKIKLSDLLNQGIRARAEHFLADYRSSIEAIMPKDDVGELPFDPLSLLGAEMTIDSTIDGFISEEEKTKKVKDGTKKNPEREGFIGFFKFWEPWSVDIYKTVYYTEEYVEWTKYAADVIGKVRAGITENCQQARAQAKANSEKMLVDFQGKFKNLNKRLMERTAELKKMSKEDQELHQRIFDNKQLVKEVELLQERLNSILSI